MNKEGINEPTNYGKYCCIGLDFLEVRGIASLSDLIIRSWRISLKLYRYKLSANVSAVKYASIIRVAAIIVSLPSLSYLSFMKT